MHALTAERYGYLGAHRPMEPQPTWWPAFRVMWNKLLDDVQRAGGYTEGEARLSARACSTPTGRISTGRCLPRCCTWTCGARTSWSTSRARSRGLVDLDRALWGDPEIEFAVLDYCGISEPAFWMGYGRQRDESPSAQIRQRFYLLYEVQKYIVIHLWRRRDPVGAQRYKEQSLRLAVSLAEGVS